MAVIALSSVVIGACALAVYMYMFNWPRSLLFSFRAYSCEDTGSRTGGHLPGALLFLPCFRIYKGDSDQLIMTPSVAADYQIVFLLHSLVCTLCLLLCQTLLSLRWQTQTQVRTKRWTKWERERRQITSYILCIAFFCKILNEHGISD